MWARAAQKRTRGCETNILIFFASTFKIRSLISSHDMTSSFSAQPCIYSVPNPVFNRENTWWPPVWISKWTKQELYLVQKPAQTLAEIPSLTSSHIAVNHLQKNLVTISRDGQQNCQPVHNQDRGHAVQTRIISPVAMSLTEIPLRWSSFSWDVSTSVSNKPVGDSGKEKIRQKRRRSPSVSL